MQKFLKISVLTKIEIKIIFYILEYKSNWLK